MPKIITDIPHINSGLMPRLCRMTFLAPKEEGVHHLELHVMSNIYLDCECIYDLTLKVVQFARATSDEPLTEMESRILERMKDRLPPGLPPKQTMKQLREFLKKRGTSHTNGHPTSRKESAAFPTGKVEKGLSKRPESSLEAVMDAWATSVGILRPCTGIVSQKHERPIQAFNWAKRVEMVISENIGLDRLAIDTMATQLWEESCDPDSSEQLCWSEGT